MYFINYLHVRPIPAAGWEQQRILKRAVFSWSSCMHRHWRRADVCWDFKQPVHQVCLHTHTSPFRGTLKPSTSPLPVCQRLAQNMLGLVYSAGEGELCSLTEPTRWTVATPGDRHPHSGIWIFVSKLGFFLCVSQLTWPFCIFYFTSRYVSSYLKINMHTALSTQGRL